LVDKRISREKTLLLYGLSNALGLACIFYLFLILDYEDIALVFYILVFSPLVLATYSIWLKRKALIGNVVVSVLVGLSFYCLGSVLIDQYNHPVVFFTLGFYAVLAFLINLSRELVKDAEDIQGDYYCQMSTLPILIGKKRTNYLVFGLINLTVLFLMSVILTYFINIKVFIFYIFSLVIIPLILISRKLLSAKSEKDYKRISFHLKLVFLSGICSMLTFLMI
jgi:4-hydroxybenzoate polyprenyltransferase